MSCHVALYSIQSFCLLINEYEYDRIDRCVVVSRCQNLEHWILLLGLAGSFRRSKCFQLFKGTYLPFLVENAYALFWFLYWEWEWEYFSCFSECQICFGSVLKSSGECKYPPNITVFWSDYNSLASCWFWIHSTLRPWLLHLGLQKSTVHNVPILFVWVK